MHVFLQSLDADGDINNGIQINDAVADAVSSHVGANGVIDFNQTIGAFSNDAGVTEILAALNDAGVFEDIAFAGNRTLRSAAAAQAHLENSLKPAVQATTEYGEIRGYTDGSIVAWRGIPFAKPPVGDLRWKAPQPPDPWTGIRWAMNSGQPAVQIALGQAFTVDGIIGSEDCLYLDIYRPDTEETDLPVYFEIHGGSNFFGSASALSSTAQTIAENRHAVLVLVQYRLGPMGWFRHSDLRNDDVTDLGNSGNFGTLDLIQALEWVQNNISAFGGNPENVTISGESAGGFNVMTMMISPLASGLFHKAISQSGIMQVVASNDDMAGVVIERLGLTGEDMGSQLRARSAREVLQAVIDKSPFNAYADGYVLPDTIINTLHQGIYNKVPVIVGFNEDEGNNLLAYYAPTIGRPDWLYINDLFNPDYDPTTEWSYTDIFPDENEEMVYQATTQLGNLSMRAKYLTELASELSRHQEDVYAYLFKWEGGGLPELGQWADLMGSIHGLNTPFITGGDDVFGNAALFVPENEAGRHALQDAIGTYLDNFIQTGDPGQFNGFTWEPWSNEEGLAKAITLDADANDVILSMETDEWTFDEVDAALADELAGWDPAFADEAGGIPTAMVIAQRPETLRFVERDHLPFDALDGATTYYGTYGYYVNQLSGYQIAGYRAEIPDNWNGDLVLYCHGFRRAPQLGVSNPGSLREHFIQNGYAWAASSYGENGYNIATGVIGTHELLKLLNANFGEMEHVYIMGHSMGGHVTARSVTEYPDAYNGALPLCGVVGGGNEQFSFTADMTLLANYFLGLNYDIPFTASEFSTLVDTMFGPVDGLARSGNGSFGWISPTYPGYTADKSAVLNTVGETFKGAVMYRSGGNRPLFHATFSNMAYFQIAAEGGQFAMDPSVGTGFGSVVDNRQHVYQLDDNFDFQSIDEVDLNNGIKRVSLSDTFDFEYLMYPVHGDITIPVISVHDIGDWYVPLSHEKLYAQRVLDAGSSDLLRTRIIRDVNHCGISSEETQEAFDDLVAWVEEGITPAGDDILTPAAVAADDFGCAFTRTQRTVEDPSMDHDDNPDTPMQWICD